ncbi:hypothetical protein GCM10022222_44890 [Amycolatopsis ultiminotia]|uniref:Uncharacterized protein n=1 Tax=Amycolatopsis ultiminotia TaxID=543629 RepID=A0ABP6WUW0_9PSEU
MLVLSSPVEVGDRRAALRKLKDLLAQNQPLERNRETIVDVVRLVGGVTSGNRLPGWNEATDLLLRGLSWYDRRRLIGKVKAMPTGSGNHQDFLIEIAKQAHGDEEDRAAVDAIICDSFLADLRLAYSGLSGTRRTMNCLVLLDNAHAPGGRAFLRALTESRRRSPNEADPLVVVATSRTWNPDWNESWSLQTAHHGGDLEHRRNPAHRTHGLAWPHPRLSSAGGNRLGGRAGPAGNPLEPVVPARTRHAVQRRCRRCRRNARGPPDVPAAAVPVPAHRRTSRRGAGNPLRDHRPVPASRPEHVAGNLVHQGVLAGRQ